MNFAIRIKTTDSSVVEALTAAKKRRLAPEFVTTAIAHYLETPAGKRTLAIMVGQVPTRKRPSTPPPVKAPTKETPSTAVAREKVPEAPISRNMSMEDLFQRVGSTYRG